MWVLILLVLSVTLRAGCRNLTTSDAPQTNDLKFRITSLRNQTGHWIAQVKLEHAANEIIGQKDSGPWEVDIHHTTTKSQGIDSVIIEAIISAPPRRPGPNYELVPGLGYYKLHTEGNTWHEARFICAQEGAYLAIINSDHETEELKAIFARHPSHFSGWQKNFAFIGISDIQTEGEWVTIFGQPLNSTGYMKWEHKEPNNGREENCGLMHRRGLLHDGGCSFIVPFFCEQEFH